MQMPMPMMAPPMLMQAFYPGMNQPLGPGVIPYGTSHPYAAMTMPLHGQPQKRQHESEASAVGISPNYKPYNEDESSDDDKPQSKEMKLAH